MHCSRQPRRSVVCTTTTHRKPSLTPGRGHRIGFRPGGERRGMHQRNTKPATFGDVVRVPEFRAIWLADAQSIAGDQIARVSLAILGFQRTNSTGLTALVYALTYVPAIVGGALLAGVAARLPPR